jgi:co-chaperonin GroES (HSP10)
MMWRPLGDRVLVRLDTPEEKVSAGGVVLPGQAVEREKIRRGVVEAIGREVKDLEAGQRVVVSGYAGHSVPDDEHARIIKVDDVLVVLDA